MGILAGMGTRSAGARDLLSTGYEHQVYATLRRVLVNAGVLSVGVAGNWKGCLDQGTRCWRRLFCFPTGSGENDQCQAVSLFTIPRSSVP